MDENSISMEEQLLESGLSEERKQMKKQMVFVQLDKALELYLSGTYNEDEDVELLKLFSLIADINNEKVTRETKGSKLFEDIREDVYRFTGSREVQQMILAEDPGRGFSNNGLELPEEMGEG